MNIQLAEYVIISLGSCHESFSDVLHMIGGPAILFPKLVNCNQKGRCLSFVQELLNDVSNHPKWVKES